MIRRKVIAMAGCVLACPSIPQSVLLRADVVIE
jgi:hypothetical protein